MHDFHRCSRSHQGGGNERSPYQINVSNSIVNFDVEQAVQRRDYQLTELSECRNALLLPVDREFSIDGFAGRGPWVRQSAAHPHSLADCGLLLVSATTIQGVRV